MVDRRILEATRLWTLALPTVSAFVGSLVRHFHDRDEVLQETAIAVLESFDKYDPQYPFIGWVLGIARNRVRIFLRDRGRSTILDPAAIDALEAAFEETPAILMDDLVECYQKLDDRSRELCRQRYELDLKPAAIGINVTMGANAVAKALQRIREQLRNCIESRLQRGNS